MAFHTGPSLEETLAGVLNDKALFRPGTKEYEQSNLSYFAASANEIQPSFIIRPPDVETLSTAVKALRPHLLRGDCLLAIRGAGHTPFATSANIQDGVTVDLRSLKRIDLGDGRSTVTIGVGETWSSVYSELENHSLTTAGGRQGCVGVGGLILGGGLSLYSGRYGFSCDSVVDFEIMLASGNVIHANALQNSDLWIALKGGLNNFGVTSFTMKTFQSGPIWGGHYHYSPEPDLVAQLAIEICDFLKDEPDQDIHCLWAVGSGHGFPVALSMMYHTKGQVSPPALQRFTELGKTRYLEKGSKPDIVQAFQNNIQVVPKADLLEVELIENFKSHELLRRAIEIHRHGSQFYATWTIRPDPGLLVKYNEMFQQTLDSIKDATGLVFMLIFQPLTKATLQSSEAAGGNAKCIPPDDGPLLIACLTPVWKSAEDDERIHTAVYALLANFKRLAQESGHLHRYIFTNYGYQEDAVMEGYGEKGVEIMKTASQKYDPDGIFQNAVPGGFKLPKD